MKHLIVLALVALLPACSSPSALPLTYTPVPTHTPQPTHTPLPTYTSLPSYTLYPTYTPYPTQTPYPTYTALPVPPTPLPLRAATPLSTATVPSVVVSSKCIAWNAASSHLGETTCVSGTVTGTFKDAKSNAFFIDFDNTWSSFYAVSFRYSWDNLQGRCVEISGKITPYNGRPQIVIANRSQLELCK